MNEQVNTCLYPASLILLFAVACIFSFRRRTSGLHEAIFLSQMNSVLLSRSLRPLQGNLM